MMFKLCYIDKVEQDGNAFSDFGTHCHKLLEDYAKDRVPLIALAEEYDASYDEAMKHSFPPFPKGMGQKYYEQGLSYFESFDGFGDEWEIISVEEKFAIDIEGETIVGLADLVLRHKETGEIMVVDHKSKSKSSMDKEKEIYRKQLYIYAMYVHDRWGVWPSVLRFNMFKEGYNIDEQFDISMVEETKKWILDTIQEIKSEKEWMVNKNNYFCRWICSCMMSCPARDAVLYGVKSE